MRLSSIARLYFARLKARSVLVQEGFTVVGIAVGVALLFASQVASASLNGSVRQLTEGIVGKSQYQLISRGPEGFSESLLSQVRALPGVSAAVPALEEHIAVIGPTHRLKAVDLIASEPRSAYLAGPLMRRFSARQLAHQNALALPEPLARSIGAASLEPIRVQVGATVKSSFLAATLGSTEIGSLVHSPIAVAPLRYAQRITGMEGRITRVFVQPRPGDDAEVSAGLRRVAGGVLNVEPADYDATLFSQAATPINQSTTTFAAVCALVGFLFAFSSMLLTVHVRRGLINDLRRDGATRWMTVKTLLFDALVLGVLASALGLGLGTVLSNTILPPNPGYLSLGFPIGSARIVTWPSVLIAVAGGLLAACVGVLTPLRDVWSRPWRPAPKDIPRSNQFRVERFGGVLLLLAATTGILILAPGSAIVGIVTLILALLLLLPLILEGLIAGIEKLQPRVEVGWLRIAILELKSPKARVRCFAVAATGAVAVFSSVTIQGSHTNLQRGLDRLFHGVSTTADLWVAPFGSQNLLATDSFPDVSAAALARIPGVRAVGEYRSTFFDYGGRRVWILAPPLTTARPLPAGQIVRGDTGLATRRLKSGGWVVISKAIATQHHLRVGDDFTLPTPQAVTLRVAALSTNLGWPPGAIVMNPADYVRAWKSPDPSAYNILLTRGASSATVTRSIRGALGKSSGLTIETGRQREQAQRAASREGLGRLTQIALLVLIAGALATATTMSAMIWQRRRRFARMKMQGYRRGVLWRALVCESALLLSIGAGLGALFGVYGQLLLSHALIAVTGFPVIISAGILIEVGSFLLVTGVAAAIVAVPGYRAASVAPYPYPLVATD